VNPRLNVPVNVGDTYIQVLLQNKPFSRTRAFENFITNPASSLRQRRALQCQNK
jgi:hypothetical protein